MLHVRNGIFTAAKIWRQKFEVISTTDMPKYY